MKLRVGDLVLVTGGKDAGREGKVTKVIPKRRFIGSDQSRVIVENINRYKRHTPRRGEGKPGSVVERDRPIPVSNVALVCPKCKQVTRVGYIENREGVKVRICRKCKGEL